MPYEKFDIARLERLNDPARFEYLDPAVMWDALGRPDPGAIVEIGAGTGMFAERFAAMAPSATIYAADIEPEMIEWMNGHRVSGAGHIVPVLAEETRVPLDDGVADVVIMINLHHELAEPSGTYAEALRLLAADGVVMVADWLPGTGGERPPDRVRAAAETIERYLRDAGFASVTSHEGLARHSLVTGTKR